MDRYRDRPAPYGDHKRGSHPTSGGSAEKNFLGLNPCTPGALIYKNYIDDYAKKQDNGTLIGGYNYGHFTIHDNINISDEQREAFISQYDVNSAEYRRKILGIRCPADGLIFQTFADDPEKFIADKKFSGIKFISIGVDFGGNGSSTTFVASAIIGKFQSLCVIADHKMQGGKGTIDPDRLNRELIDFYKYVSREYPNQKILYIDCDNEEQTLINGIRAAFARARIDVIVRDCYKGTINSRIYALNGLISQGRFKVLRCCKNVIDSLCTQVWDISKITEDVRLDDGTCDIDTADALEYSFSRFIKYFNIHG